MESEKHLRKGNIFKKRRHKAFRISSGDEASTSSPDLMTDDFQPIEINHRKSLTEGLVQELLEKRRQAEREQAEKRRQVEIERAEKQRQVEIEQAKKQMQAENAQQEKRKQSEIRQVTSTPYVSKVSQRANLDYNASPIYLAVNSDSNSETFPNKPASNEQNDKNVFSDIQNNNTSRYFKTLPKKSTVSKGIQTQSELTQMKINDLPSEIISTDNKENDNMCRKSEKLSTEPAESNGTQTPQMNINDALSEIISTGNKENENMCKNSKKLPKELAESNSTQTSHMNINDLSREIISSDKKENENMIRNSQKLPIESAESEDTQSAHMKINNLSSKIISTDNKKNKNMGRNSKKLPTEPAASDSTQTSQMNINDLSREIISSDNKENKNMIRNSKKLATESAESKDTQSAHKKINNLSCEIISTDNKKNKNMGRNSKKLPTELAESRDTQSAQMEINDLSSKIISTDNKKNKNMGRNSKKLPTESAESKDTQSAQMEIDDLSSKIISTDNKKNKNMGRNSKKLPTELAESRDTQSAQMEINDLSSKIISTDNKKNKNMGRNSKKLPTELAESRDTQSAQMEINDLSSKIISTDNKKNKNMGRNSKKLLTELADSNGTQTPQLNINDLSKEIISSDNKENKNMSRNSKKLIKEPAVSNGSQSPQMTINDLSREIISADHKEYKNITNNIYTGQDISKSLNTNNEVQKTKSKIEKIKKRPLKVSTQNNKSVLPLNEIKTSNKTNEIKSKRFLRSASKQAMENNASSPKNVNVNDESDKLLAVPSIPKERRPRGRPAKKEKRPRGKPAKEVKSLAENLQVVQKLRTIIHTINNTNRNEDTAIEHKAVASSAVPSRKSKKLRNSSKEENRTALLNINSNEVKKVDSKQNQASRRSQRNIEKLRQPEISQVCNQQITIETSTFAKPKEQERTLRRKATKICYQEMDNLEGILKGFKKNKSTKRKTKQHLSLKNKCTDTTSSQKKTESITLETNFSDAPNNDRNTEPISGEIIQNMTNFNPTDTLVAENCEAGSSTQLTIAVNEPAVLASKDKISFKVNKKIFRYATFCSIFEDCLECSTYYKTMNPSKEHLPTHSEISIFLSDEVTSKETVCFKKESQGVYKAKSVAYNFINGGLLKILKGNSRIWKEKHATGYGVIDGESVLQIMGQSQSLKKGSVFIAPKGCKCSINNSSDSDILLNYFVLEV